MTKHNPQPNEPDKAIEEPTVEWLIDQIAPNPGNSPLLDFNKKRLKALLAQQSQAAVEAYKAGLISKLPEKQDEHPIDPETGATVETYGYEEQHNKLLDTVKAIIMEES